MFLLVLDKNPVKAAELVPDKLKFKQLLELCQLICSAGISNVYKPIKQGKELQEWIKKYPEWILFYMETLFNFCCINCNLSIETIHKQTIISKDLLSVCKDYSFILESAIFRYSKDYQCNIPTNTELPINECIEQYKKYIEWKKENNIKGYI